VTVRTSWLALPQPLGARGFAALRIALGGYLVHHFVTQLPHAEELYGQHGVLPYPGLNPSTLYLPATPWIFDSAARIQALLVLLAGGALLLLLGVARRSMAVALWLGLVVLLHRNNLTTNIGLPYLGWLLLATALVPEGEAFALARPRAEARCDWRCPPLLVYGGWVVFGLSYSYAGWMKALAIEWSSGHALSLIAAQPIAYTMTATLVSDTPERVLELATWGTVAAELLCAPLVLFAPTRALVWCTLSLMQVGLLASLRLTELSLGVLLFHALLFDPSWIARTRPSHEETPLRAPQTRPSPR